MAWLLLPAPPLPGWGNVAVVYHGRCPLGMLLNMFATAFGLEV